MSTLHAIKLKIDRLLDQAARRQVAKDDLRRELRALKRQEARAEKAERRAADGAAVTQ